MMLDEVFRNAHFIDLTQTLGPDTVLWSEEDRFTARVQADHDKDGMYYRFLEMPEHSGTHVDAPVHFGPGQVTLSEVPIDRLVVPVFVADVRGLCSVDEDFAYGEPELNEFEDRHGKVSEGSAFLLCTGWDRYRNDADKYLRSMRFPGFGEDAAETLIDRGVVGIGIDTLSVDAGKDQSYPVHHATQPKGIWHLEGLMNLDRVPATGAWLIAAPVKLEDGSGGPARAFAIAPDHSDEAPSI